MKYIFYILCFSVAITSNAFGGGMVHKWKSPSFSGIGASAHFLTIENQEFTRKAEIRGKKDSAAAKKISAAKNTNYAKFLDNLESRIYAEFSKQLTDNLFGESCGTTYTTATVDGVTTTYTKDVANDIVILDIVGPDGSQVITLPLNDFQF